MNKYYPVYLKIKEELCIVVGGGEVAERKVHSLLEYNAHVKIISPKLTPELEQLASKNLVIYKQDYYRYGDLKNAFLVISATDKKNVNRAVANECAERGILINVINKPSLANFYVPSTLKRGPLSIAVSTAGKSPLMAKIIREDLEILYGQDFADFINFLSEQREKLILSMKDSGERHKLLKKLVDRETLLLLRQGNLQKAKERVISVCSNYWTKP
ncbi:MAG: bifunctional precorrin-2 dehydrogenase/sirohydrochlorin ferrochelatase [Clostridiales bacterium]|nr:bifunctional precorrin-2 dehydrogenase/sirohydrochlorin ferrochelatase [Clostridiales bacterium]MCF8021925.1 bifunctional precorrin-2 dehydrogenase/sirohydrochlorin ferrochelatase [Clostridiales bacterium]